MKQINDEWFEWTQTNLKRGCRKADIQHELRRQGFSDAQILLAMSCQNKAQWQAVSQQKPKKQIESSIPAGAQRNRDYKALSKPKLVKNPKAKKVDVEGAQVYLLDDFMSEAECEQIIQVINEHLRPSTLTFQEHYEGFRTSSTCDLVYQKKSYDIVAEIDQRLADTLGISLSWSEAIQAQKYEVGQEFKPHMDYFFPGTYDFAKHAEQKGQRTWTFMVYLNDTPAGGATHFTKLDKTFYPQRGRAVIWNNLNRDGSPNPLTQHHGMPVEEGEKIIITKWFRDKGEGKMLS